MPDKSHPGFPSQAGVWPILQFCEVGMYAELLRACLALCRTVSVELRVQPVFFSLLYPYLILPVSDLTLPKTPKYRKFSVQNPKSRFAAMLQTLPFSGRHPSSTGKSGCKDIPVCIPFRESAARRPDLQVHGHFLLDDRL